MIRKQVNTNTSKQASKYKAVKNKQTNNSSQSKVICE